MVAEWQDYLNDEEEPKRRAISIYMSGTDQEEVEAALRALSEAIARANNNTWPNVDTLVEQIRAVPRPAAFTIYADEASNDGDVASFYSKVLGEAFFDVFGPTGQ